ncbi:WD domain-containing protein 26 [Elsinoe fawcettii]|nr:WD domain-containing protein 26 [Elsinoe fawcettii]
MKVSPVEDRNASRLVSAKISVQHQHGQYPVTALAISSTWLYASEGPSLNLYDRHKCTLVHTVRVFDDASIHGLNLWATDGEYLLIWGGPYVAVLRILAPADQGEISKVQWILNPTGCPDWILDGQFAPVSYVAGEVVPTRAALLTAHNALLLLNLNDLAEKSRIEIATSQSRSILYCAKICWEDQHRLLLAGGTVFGQIIVWSATLSAQGTNARLHRIFTGHEGSPFGLCFSANVIESTARHPLRLLASCSDDRSIRLWDVSELDDLNEDPQMAADGIISSDSNTGFATDDPESVVKSRGLVAKAMGHQSRIWGVHFLPSAKSDFRLVTFGEDATCQYWQVSSLHTSDGGCWSGHLQNIGHQDRHSGKHIWSHACFESRADQSLIATGGADGSISLLHAIGAPAATPVSVHQSQVQVSKIRSYSFVTSKELFLVSNTGMVSAATIPGSITAGEPLDANSMSLRDLHQEADLAGFSMTASVPEQAVVFLAGKSGSLYYYNPDIGFHKALDGSRKAAGVFARSVPPPADQSSPSMCLLYRLGEAVAELVSLTVASTANVLHAQLQLPTNQHISSFNIVSADNHGYLLAIGFRSGTLALYTITFYASPEDLVPATAQLSQHVHSDAITDILTTHLSTGTYLTLSSRSGSASIHLLDCSPLALTEVHHLPTSLSEVSLLIPFPNSEPTAAGFHKKAFHLLPATSTFTTGSIDCGGSNRSWTFLPLPPFPFPSSAPATPASSSSSGTPAGILAWTSASRILLQTAVVEDAKRINPGGHGREIRAVAVSPLLPGLGRVVATGAEDTDIKLSVFGAGADFGSGSSVKGRKSLRCLRTLRRHNTGLQDLKWSGDGRYLVSAGGCDEVFVWRVRVLPKEMGEVGVVCESVCPFVSEEGDLRVMALDVESGGGRAGEAEGEDECGRSRIAVVRSDSSVGVYWYEYVDGIGTWTRAWEGTYLTCCLTNILAFPETENVFLTTATDGHAAIGRLSAQVNTCDDTANTIEWRQRFKVHQSAVHTATLIPWTQNTHVLLSGGDDNALSISLIRDGGDNISTLTVPRAHAAALTALEVIAAKPDEGVVTIATASLDQRIKLWRVTIDVKKPGVDGVEMTKLENRYTAVADVACVDSWIEDDEVVVMICGVGWDVWRFTGDGSA